MSLSKSEACKILEVSPGSSVETIKSHYKAMALKHHPDKHGNSVESIEYFQKLTAAYNGLISDSLEDSCSDNDEEDEQNINDMLAHFYVAQHQNFCEYRLVYGESDSEDYDDYFDDHDLELEYTTNDLPPAQIEKNANELIKEELHEKKKQERKKAKKKRRKEKKKTEKEIELNSTQSDVENACSVSNTRVLKNKLQNNQSKSMEEDEIDENAAFFTKAVSRSKKLEKPAKTCKNQTSNGSSKTRSIEHALKGNEYAKSENYFQAIDQFTEAMKLEPTDFKFVGNRSFCYEKLGDYEQSLDDALAALKIAHDWPKGYYRKGRALLGLKKYSEAEAAFKKVLELDSACQDAQREIFNVGCLQIMEMGFSRQKAHLALEKYTTVPAALDALVTNKDILPKDLYESDDNDYEDDNHHLVKSAPKVQNLRPVLRNKENKPSAGNNKHTECSSIWIGNITSSASQEELIQLFSRKAKVSSCRVLPEKKCAFVNFDGLDTAQVVLDQLQGVEYRGQKLLLRLTTPPPQHSHGRSS